MPSFRATQGFTRYICLGLGTLLLGSALNGCGSGESGATVVENPPVETVPKPKSFNIKVPFELRNITVRIYDNFDNTLVLEQNANTTTDLMITLPRILNRERLYRIEVSSNPNTLIYDAFNGQYQNINLTQHALVNVDTSSLTQSIFIHPASEAIYQRALIRSGYLPTDSNINNSAITSLQLNLATADVNSALVNAFSQLNITNLTPSNLLDVFTPQDVASKPVPYSNTYLSFGYLRQWANDYPDSNYAEFTQSLATDLKDGYLDAKQLRGDDSTPKKLLNIAPENTDPAKNTLLNIVNNQKEIRTQFAAALKNSVLQLATIYKQDIQNPEGYRLLQEQNYLGPVPAIDTRSYFRLAGAGDYRRAVGFTDTEQGCHGSKYPCKQGLTGINLDNPNLPSIEYLIGNYKDKTTGCQLNIRANGVLELIKDSQAFSSTLNADSTDNMLQKDKATHEYILNSSSPESSSSAYNFVQIHIRNNQVLSASAGLDSRQAPDQLQTPKLECSFI